MTLSEYSTNYVLAGRIGGVIRFVAGIEGRTQADVLCAAMRVYVRQQHPNYILRDRPDGSFSMVQVSVARTLYDRTAVLPEKPPQPFIDLPPDIDAMTYADVLEHNAGLINENARAMEELNKKPMAPKGKPAYRNSYKGYKRKKWVKGIGENPAQDGLGGVPRSWGGR